MAILNPSMVRMRDELLAREIFNSVWATQVLIEMWCKHYNTIRPHRSLGYKPPSPATVVIQPSQFQHVSLTLWLVHILGADQIIIQTPKIIIPLSWISSAQYGHFFTSCYPSFPGMETKKPFRERLGTVFVSNLLWTSRKTGWIRAGNLVLIAKKSSILCRCFSPLNHGLESSWHAPWSSWVVCF